MSTALCSFTSVLALSVLSNVSSALGIHQGHGTVEFHLSVSCPCSYLCVVNDVKNKLYECHCPINKTLAKDGHTCIGEAV